MDFRGQTVFLIGGGPSVTGQDLDGLRGQGVVVAINDAFRTLPWADAIFTADGSWLRNRAEELRQAWSLIYAALPADLDLAAYFEDVRLPDHLIHLERRDGARLNPNPQVVHYADNSGFGALTWAAALGAPRIVLCGYDLQEEGWWHGGYEWESKGMDRYADWAVSYWLIARDLRRRGVDVVNTNPDSAIRCFRFARLEDCLSEAAA